jgi:quinol monooxygenase YgiN
MSEVVVVASLQAKPGREATFEQELRKLVAPTHAEAGCLLFAAQRHADDPTRYCVIERWTSQEALDEHFQTPHIRDYLARTEELLATPTQVDVYVPVPEGDPAKGRL